MLNGPLLVTERLILRPPAAEDFDAFAEMCAEEETMTFIGGSCARSQAWRQWCTLAGAWHIRGFSMFSVLERASGEWVGRLGPWEGDRYPRAPACLEVFVPPGAGQRIHGHGEQNDSPFENPLVKRFHIQNIEAIAHKP